MVTVSLFSFIKNLRAQDVAGHDPSRRARKSDVTGTHLTSFIAAQPYAAEPTPCNFLFQGGHQSPAGW